MITIKNNAFGMVMPERIFSNEKYRWGYNGKETDNETNWQDYGFRIYYPGLGKFLSVDPLFKSYPWYTPYQFAGNTPISCIDLDGLEMYFAADGSFLGQSKHGGSEIRVATSYTLHNETTKWSGKNGWYEITKSQPLSQFDLETAGKVYKTIYDREIKGSAKVFANVAGETQTGASSKGEPIKVNINNELMGDYYNVANTLYHENKHYLGISSVSFDHFSIWRSQVTEDKNFANTDSYMKKYLAESGHDYLRAMEGDIQYLSATKAPTDYINEVYKTYKANVSEYNSLMKDNLNHNYQAESLNDLTSYKKSDKSESNSTGKLIKK